MLHVAEATAQIYWIDAFVAERRLTTYGWEVFLGLERKISKLLKIVLDKTTATTAHTAQDFQQNCY